MSSRRGGNGSSLIAADVNLRLRGQVKPSRRGSRTRIPDPDKPAPGSGPWDPLQNSVLLRRPGTGVSRDPADNPALGVIAASAEPPDQAPEFPLRELTAPRFAGCFGARGRSASVTAGVRVREPPACHGRFGADAPRSPPFFPGGISFRRYATRSVLPLRQRTHNGAYASPGSILRWGLAAQVRGRGSGSMAARSYARPCSILRCAYRDQRER